jgi:hypothetical protein
MATVITFGRVRRQRDIIVVLIVESVLVPHAHFKLLTLNEELDSFITNPFGSEYSDRKPTMSTPKLPMPFVMIIITTTT